MKYCTKCGTQLIDTDKFCTKCGAAQDVFVNTNNNRRSEREVFDDNTSDKSRTVASLLAFFLGGFGALDFYIGKKKKAITKLSLTILSFIITVVIVVLYFNSANNQNADVYYDYNTLYANLLGQLAIPYLLNFVVSIWNLVDFIITISGNQKDGEGKVISNWH